MSSLQSAVNAVWKGRLKSRKGKRVHFFISQNSLRKRLQSNAFLVAYVQCQCKIEPISQSTVKRWSNSTCRASRLVTEICLDLTLEAPY